MHIPRTHLPLLEELRTPSPPLLEDDTPPSLSQVPAVTSERFLGRLRRGLAAAALAPEVRRAGMLCFASSLPVALLADAAKRARNYGEGGVTARTLVRCSHSQRTTRAVRCNH